MAGRVEVHPDDQLRDELTLLRVAMARVLRSKLDGDVGEITPAWMDQARKFLTDQGMVRTPGSAPRAPAVTIDLPFTDPETE